MNFHDMVRLTHKCIQDGRIEYNRRKTGHRFSIPFTKPLQEIAQQFPQGESQYLFPILSDFHQTETQKQNRIHKCIGQYNKDLKKVTEILDIPVEMTSYTARYTFASTLYLNDFPVAHISELMGHANQEITRKYLKDLGHNVLDNAHEVL